MNEITALLLANAAVWVIVAIAIMIGGKHGV